MSCTGAKIEVTPEMIAAGEEVYYRHQGGDGPLVNVAVFAIFKAMVAASPTLRRMGPVIEP